MRDFSIGSLNEGVISQSPLRKIHHDGYRKLKSRKERVLEKLSGNYRDVYETLGIKFSQKSQAYKAIAELVAKARNLNVPLFLSYSSNGIVPIRDILKIFEQHYSEVILKSLSLDYSSQGRLMDKGVSNKSTGTEYLVIATT